jgi:toxin-antitoxin system PIN domain toxin
MIVPDGNLLIYANHPTSSFHALSRAWLEATLSSSELVGIPAISIYAFLRFITSSKIHPRPATFLEASQVVEAWLGLPNVRMLYPGDRHWHLLKQLGSDTRASGKFITDVVIAAIAVEHGGIVHTNDNDFARFSGVRWHNPLRP